MDQKQPKLPIIDTVSAVTLVLVDLEPWDSVGKLSNGSTGNGYGRFRTGNQLISAGSGPKTAKNRQFFFKNFQNQSLVLLEVANFSKILLVNLGYGRSLAKSCWNLTFFSTPPEFFRQNKVLQQFYVTIFLPKSWNFPKFFFSPLENQRFLAKSLENFA